jgi:long-chain acyl-CoA synthetase
MLTHRNIVSNATTAVKLVHVRFGDRALSILPLSHMFEMTIDIAILYVGGTIVYSRSLSPDTLLKLFASQRITCMVLVPQALQLFLNGIEREVRRQKKEKQWELLHRIAPYVPFKLRRLLFATVHKRLGGFFRFFVSGGAYLAPKLAQRWENMGVRIIQGYGATECAPIITVTPQDEHVLASVGKPLPDVDVRIADDHEILVHGPNVAPGYWKSPEATQLAFQDGWYHTGDLGYFDERGFLYLKGRKKNLIVLANGMNVYPEDVENALTSVPGVKDAVVFGLSEREQGPEVHGVLLVENLDRAKVVVQQANRLLASHQQIRGFTVWPEEDFPRTHTLKVKRQEVLSTLEAIRAH